MEYCARYRQNLDTASRLYYKVHSCLKQSRIKQRKGRDLLVRQHEERRRGLRGAGVDLIADDTDYGVWLQHPCTRAAKVELLAQCIFTREILSGQGLINY